MSERQRQKSFFYPRTQSLYCSSNPTTPPISRARKFFKKISHENLSDQSSLKKNVEETFQHENIYRQRYISFSFEFWCNRYTRGKFRIFPNFFRSLSLSLILYYFILVLLGCLCELIVRPSSIYRSSHIINQKICFLFFLLASSSWIYFEGVMTCRRYKKLNFINLTSANCYLIFIFIINSSNFMLNWISAEILSH